MLHIFFKKISNIVQQTLYRGLLIHNTIRNKEWNIPFTLVFQSETFSHKSVVFNWDQENLSLPCHRMPTNLTLLLQTTTTTMRPYVTVLTENPGDRHKDKGCFFWPICDICLVANLVQSAFSTSLLSDLRDWEDPSCLFLATGSCAFVGFWVWVWFAKRILSPPV